jgi:hypothetical protein
VDKTEVLTTFEKPEVATHDCRVKRTVAIDHRDQVAGLRGLSWSDEVAISDGSWIFMVA